MRKIVSLIIMIFFFIMTIYVSLIWEPSGNIIKDRSISNNNEKVKDENLELNNKSNTSSSEDIERENSSSVNTSSFQILKLPPEEIIERLSWSEKGELFNLAYKIQEVDRKRIIDWIKQKDLSGFEKAYRLIKTRLSSVEFDKISTILEPYINMDMLKMEA
ncbi:MAG: hypothetical protein ACRC7N_06415 [Clostridium sp.]